jgi:hypothetical protein
LRALVRAETEHASVQVLADSLLMVGQKRNSATLEPGFRSLANAAANPPLPLKAWSSHSRGWRNKVQTCLRDRARISRSTSRVLLCADTGGGAEARQRLTRTSNGGRGIAGMRERVALYGGELTVGPRPVSGFVARARFPIEDP